MGYMGPYYNIPKAIFYLLQGALVFRAFMARHRCIAREGRRGFALSLDAWAAARKTHASHSLNPTSPLNRPYSSPIYHPL